MSDTTGSPTSQHAEENRTVTAPNHPFQFSRSFALEAAELLYRRRRVAAALDGPPWAFDVAAPPLPRRLRLAIRIGDISWRLGYTLTQAGDRVINAGDWLATKVAGPAGA